MKKWISKISLGCPFKGALSRNVRWECHQRLLNAPTYGERKSHKYKPHILVLFQTFAHLSFIPHHPIPKSTNNTVYVNFVNYKIVTGKITKDFGIRKKLLKIVSSEPHFWVINSGRHFNFSIWITML